MKVSVIIPNYNHGRFLKERIQSVLEQSFQDFELILLDDFSTDNSLEIISEFRGHPKVSNILINRSCSGSPFLQWQKGLDYAQGEWIWFAESDDLADRNFLEELIGLGESRPGIGVCYSDSYILDEDGSKYPKRFSDIKRKRFDSGHWDRSYFNEGKKEIRDYLLCTCTINNSSSAIIRRDLLVDANCFDQRFRYTGEWYMFLKVLALSDIAYCSKPLCSVRNALRPHHKQFEYSAENFRIYHTLLRENPWLERKTIERHLVINTRHSLIRNAGRGQLNNYFRGLRLNPRWMLMIFFHNLAAPLSDRLASPSARRTMGVLGRWGGSSYKLAAGKTAKLLGMSHFRKYLDEEYLCQRIESAGFRIHNRKSEWLISPERSPRKIICRKYSSDLSVFLQTLVRPDLDDLIMQIRSLEQPINCIVDAGSNIGLVALKFAWSFPEARIWCIEPELSNLKILKQNLERNHISARSIPKGIWRENTRLYFDRTFRDGKEWSVSLSDIPPRDEAGEMNSIESISLNQLIREEKIGIVDILKIDIEGAEAEIFTTSEEGLEFLDRTRVLLLEVHPEACSEAFVADILRRKNFKLGKSGEYLVGFNRNLIG